MDDLTKSIAGVILGCAVGDSIGLPSEGMSAARIQRRWPDPLTQRLFFGKGMVSDDTEHTVFVAQALIAHPNDVKSFQRALAWKLRWWLLGIPAGVGLATLRSILKLWVGFPPHSSGVYSAGNGPAMRSPILGAFFCRDKEQLIEYIRASTRLTHTDNRAFTGALAVALCTRWAVLHGDDTTASPFDVLKEIESIHDEGDDEWPVLIEQIRTGLKETLTVQDFAKSLGLSKGVTGYVYHTVPVVVYAWLRHHSDFESMMKAIIQCGGDTDTVGAIAGALAGASVGTEGIPQDWLNNIVDWPCSPPRLVRLSKRLASVYDSGVAGKPIPTVWPFVLVRNVFFITIVLGHGFRRLLPPY